MSKVIVKKTHKLPLALSLEESVLGALLLEKEAIIEVIDILQPEHFHYEQHTLIYKAILELFQHNRAIDARTIVNQLTKNNNLEKAGGISYIANLMQSVASAGHIQDHAHILIEYAMRRSMIKIGNKISTNANDESIDVFNVLDEAEKSFFDMAHASLKKDYVDIGNLLHTSFQELEKRKEKSQEGITGVPTGFIDMDRFLLGWQKSDFVVLAGRPGMGKTAFMLNLLRNASVDHQVAVAFFSLEMSSMQLINRLMSSEANIPGEKIKRGNLEEYEWQILATKTDHLSKAPIYIDDTPGLSLFEFRSKCRRLKYQKNIQVVFLDYLQLMHDGNTRNAGNREQQIATISRGIKSIAKELDITIVVASQLSRSVETRGGDKRPQLSDLRESGAIEQDADLVIFPYRPDYYGLTEDANQNDMRDIAEIIIAKHRNGPTGKVLLRYIATCTKFGNLAQQADILESKMNVF